MARLKKTYVGNRRWALFGLSHDLDLEKTSDISEVWEMESLDNLLVELNALAIDGVCTEQLVLEGLVLWTDVAEGLVPLVLLGVMGPTAIGSRHKSLPLNSCDIHTTCVVIARWFNPPSLACKLGGFFVAWRTGWGITLSVRNIFQLITLVTVVVVVIET
jgi:hypothetical protein